MQVAGEKLAADCRVLYPRRVCMQRLPVRTSTQLKDDLNINVLVMSNVGRSMHEKEG